MERLSGDKVFYHSDRLLDIKERGDAYPVHMVVGVTDYCNHHCIFCNSDFRTGDNSCVNAIDREVLLTFLKEAKSAGLKAVTICGSGEPLIYPEIEDLLYSISEIGLDIGIFSNGARLAKDGIRKAVLDTCTFIRLSINASNEREHETVHQVKGEFRNIVESVRLLVEERAESGKKLPTIGTQFVFYEENYKSIVDATRLWKQVGVDYFEIKPLIEGEGSQVNLTVFPATDREAVYAILDEARKYESEDFKVYAKYSQYDATRTANGRGYGKCYGHALDPNLWSDGNLFICSNHEHEGDIIGNIYKESFLEIWNGERRKKRIEEIEVTKCPRGCRCDPINKIIWDYLHPDKLTHPNFI